MMVFTYIGMDNDNFLVIFLGGSQSADIRGASTSQIKNIL